MMTVIGVLLIGSFLLLGIKWIYTEGRKEVLALLDASTPGEPHTHGDD